MSRHQERTTRQQAEIGTIASLALIGGVIGLASERGIAGALMLATAAAAVGFGLARLASPRAGLAGGLALALGAIFIEPRAGTPFAWGDALLLVGMVQTAVIGSLRADVKARRFLPEAGEAEPQPSGPGGWMTIVVTGEGPSETQGKGVRLPQTPRRDPERRGLGRLADRPRPVATGPGL